MEDAAIVSETEIRGDFAQRLERRMAAMQSSAKCTCSELSPGLVATDHVTGCPKHVWQSVRRILGLMLGECSGEEEENDPAA